MDKMMNRGAISLNTTENNDGRKLGGLHNEEPLSGVD